MSKINKQDWRLFEKLIFQILLDEYKIQKSEINTLTKKTKDGGYDGIFYVPYNTEESSSKRMLQMLFEAKLRSNINHDLSLQEFSKALIIAINKNADRLIIATNLHFSKNTTDLLNEYAQETGLSIQLKSSVEIFDWIKTHPEAICNSVQTTSLYNLLKESYNVEYNKFYDKSQPNIFERKDRIILDKIYGSKRIEQKDLAKDEIKAHNGIITIEGEAGIGKTIFINNLLNELENEGFRKYIFDLQTFSTPRTLFIDMVCKIWNIKYEAFCTINANEIEDILCYLGNENIEEITNKIVSNVLSCSKDTYSQHSDVYEFNLINYIYKLYKLRNEKRKIIITFININYASKELISFIINLCRKIGQDLNIVLEIRTSCQENDKINSVDWNEMLDKLLNLPNIRKHYLIAEWSGDELYYHIYEQFMPYKISKETCISIYRKIGNNPLYLNAYIELIKYNLYSKKCLISNVNGFIKKCEIDNFSAILINYITAIINSRFENSVICFALFAMFGRLSLDVLEKLLGDDYNNYVSDFLKVARFVSIYSDTLIVKHMLYLECLRTICINNIPLLLQQKLASKLLDIELIRNPQSSENIEIKILLLKILNRKSELIKECVSYATDLFDQGQYYKSLEQFTQAYCLLPNLSEEERFSNDIEFRCRCGIMSTRIKLNSFQSENINFKAELEQCELFLKTKFKEHTADDQIKLYLIEYRYYHLLGEFTQALKISEKMIEVIDKNLVSDELASKVASEYCIAIKETSSLSCALKKYKEASQRYPKSKELKFSRLSHLASKYGAISPKRTMWFLERCTELGADLSMASQFHNRVNILACLFLDKKYEQAEKLATELLDDLFVFGYRSEEGRAINNLGCVKVALGFKDEALKLFEYSITIYKNGKYVAFLWPSLINRISLSLVYDNMDCVEEYADACLNIFKENYYKRIRNFTFNQKYFDKLFVGIAILCTYYRNKDKDNMILGLVSTLSHPTLELKLSKINNYSTLVNLLKGTVYEHNGVILVKA